MSCLNMDALTNASLRRDPFEYTIVSEFLSPETVRTVISSYPEIAKGGSFPLDSLSLSPALEDLISALDGPEFENAVERKFDVELADRPKMYSLRGMCRATDGKIHTDSKDKIITVLLYLNETWDSKDGRLRMLRGGGNLNDYAEEVPPENGTLLVFRRSDRSYHGHTSFDGVRRSIQMNWMVSENKRAFHKIRHSLSARFKKLAAAS